MLTGPNLLVSYSRNSFPGKVKSKYGGPVVLFSLLNADIVEMRACRQVLLYIASFG